MEVCVPSSKSSYLEGYSNRGSLKIPLKTNQNTRTDLSVSDLKTCLAEIMVKDGSDVSNVEWDFEINEKELHKNDESAHSASEKLVGKCCACPPNQESTSSMDRLFLDEKQEGDFTVDFEANVSANSLTYNQSCLQSKSLPIPSKLLSALKGSRKKQGMPPKKLSVTWAPDVYDPVPSSASHVPSSKNHHYRCYGKRKNKHKRNSKSSSRSSGKDIREKKQTPRKNVGASSSLEVKPMLDYDRGSDVFPEPLGNENSLHLPPAAEAT